MSNDVVCDIKPKFVLLVRLISAEMCVLLICFSSAFIPLLAIAVSEPHASATAKFILFILIGIFLLIETIYLFFNYKNYNATTYTIYSDKIEFEEGFINHKYASLKFSDIKEIHLTQNFIQRFAGLGSIKFVTAANAVDGISGLLFRDIENSKEIYKKVKDMQSQSSD